MGMKLLYVLRWILRKFVLSVSILALMLRLVNGGRLYVSKDKGHDKNSTNTCENMTSPCQTLGYAIKRAKGGDVIMLDFTNTNKKPYDTCPTQKISKSLTFQSSNGSAVLNCSGNSHGLNFNGSSVKVEFHGLRFLDTFLRVYDASLQLVNCSFGVFKRNATFLYMVKATISTPQGNPRINITNLVFLDKNVAGALHVLNNQSVPVVVEMNNVKIANNIIEKANYVIFVQGHVNFDFTNSEISNTSFANVISSVSAEATLVKLCGCPIRVAKQDTSSRSYNTINESSEHGKPARYHINSTKGLEENESDSSTILKYYITAVNVSFNQGKFIDALLHSKSRIVITDTRFYNNTLNSLNQYAAVQIKTESQGIPLEVILRNNLFTYTKNMAMGYIIWIYSRTLNLSVTNCNFSRNIGGAVYVQALPPCSISFQRSRIEFGYLNTANIWLTFNNIGKEVLFGERRIDRYTTNGEFLKSDRDFHKDIPSLRSLNSHPRKLEGLYSPEYRKSKSIGLPSLSVEDCEFRNNTGLSLFGATLKVQYQPYLGLSRSFSPTIEVRRCIFSGNIAADGTGGIYIGNYIDLNIFHSVFRKNAGSEAGAIFFAGSSIFIYNCTFDSNSGGYKTSSQAHGSVKLYKNSLNKGTDAVIQDSRILQHNVVESSRKGSFHGYLAVSTNYLEKISISNCIVEFKWPPSLEKAIVLEIAHTASSRLDIRNTSIQCPMGYDVRRHKIGANGSSFQCNLCPIGSYSLDHGIYTESKTHSVTCLLCPYGANCTRGLQVLPNFWGYKIKENPPTVQFSRCPLGYCCQKEDKQRSCVQYNVCNLRRVGRLCGECGDGYTETLFTPSCRKSEECKDYWFWPLGVIFVLGISLYVIIQPDISKILYRSITWFRANPSQVAEGGDETSNSGPERILFFYYQAINILTVQTSDNALWDSHLTQFTLGIFNFDLRLNREGFACPFPGLNAVRKLFFHTLGVFSVLLAIPAIFLLHKAISLCFPRYSPRNAVYLSAFLKIVFLGYTVLAEKSIKSLQCVSVDGVNCLFVNCNIECYTWWQKIIGTLVAVFFVPFIFVLFFGARKLYEKKISVLHFFLACLFPLPFLSYWFLNRRHLSGKFVQDTSGRSAVTSVLIGSYRVPDHVSAGAVYWESVLIGRMLVLIIAVLIQDQFLRSLALLLLCIINLSVHIYVRPFERALDNRAETLSLFCLVLLTMFNLPFMAYLSEGVTPVGPMSKVMNVFSWCQVVLVAFVPLICAVLAFVALVSQAVRLLFNLTKCVRFACSRCASCFGMIRRNEELAEPLMT